MSAQQTKVAPQSGEPRSETYLTFQPVGGGSPIRFRYEHGDHFARSKEFTILTPDLVVRAYPAGTQGSLKIDIRRYTGRVLMERYGWIIGAVTVIESPPLDEDAALAGLANISFSLGPGAKLG